MAGIITQRSPRAGDGGMLHDPEWHINRPTTAQRIKEINESARFVAKETNLTTVWRGFHFKADRAERRRAWHVSEKWKARHIKKKPWKEGQTPTDPRVDTSHLKRVTSPEAQERFQASLVSKEQPAEVPEEEPSLSEEKWGGLEGEMEGASLEQLLEEAELESDAILEEQEHISEWYDKDPIYKDAVFEKEDKAKPWKDVTGAEMLRHGTDGKLLEDRPESQEGGSDCSDALSDHQHDNLVKFLVDDRFLKGKPGFRRGNGPTVGGSKKLKKKAALQAKKNRWKEPAGPVHMPKPKPLTKGLSEESQRMEQNRILRQMTENEFQRETERRMMIATIANPRKRLLLHQYFEEQRALAAKEINDMVDSCEHAVLRDMGLAGGDDLRGPNFQRTYQKPVYFPEIADGPPTHDPFALTPAQEKKLRQIKNRAKSVQSF